MEEEKRQWEQVVSDLSLQITSLGHRLKVSEEHKRCLRKKIDSLEENSEGLLSAHPSAFRSRSISPASRRQYVVDKENDSIKQVNQKLVTRQQSPLDVDQIRLQTLNRELEEALKKKNESRQRIIEFERALHQLKEEKAATAQQIIEQDKRHKQEVLEKDRFIKQLEKQRKRADELKVEAQQKIAGLQKRCDDLSRRQLQHDQQHRSTYAGSGRARTVNSASSGFVSRGVRAGSVTVAQPQRPSVSELSEVKDVLRKAVNLKVKTALCRLEVAKLEKRLDQVVEEIDELEGSKSSFEDQGAYFEALGERVEALRIERKYLESELNHERQLLKEDRQQPLMSSEAHQIIQEANSALIRFPDVALNFLLELHCDAAIATIAKEKECAKREKELQDLRRCYASAKSREKTLIHEAEKQKLDVLINANRDKLLFMESCRRSLKNGAHLRTRSCDPILCPPLQSHSTPRHATPQLTSEHTDLVPKPTTRRLSIAASLLSRENTLEDTLSISIENADFPEDLVLIADTSDIHVDYITSLALSPHQKMLITGSLGEIKVWDVLRLDSVSESERALLFSWKTQDSTYRSSDFIRSITTVSPHTVCAGLGPSIKLFDLRMRRCVHSWAYAPNFDLLEADQTPPIVTSMVGLQTINEWDDGVNFAAGGSDLTIRLFDPRAKGLLPICKVPSGEQRSVLESIRVPKCDEDVLQGLVCGGNRGVARIWDHGWSFLPSNTNLGVLHQLRYGHLKIQQNHSWQSLASISDRDDRLRLWIWSTLR